MSHTTQPRKLKNLSYCNETETGASSSYSSPSVKPRCKCGELAVIRASWTNENSGRRRRTRKLLVDSSFGLIRKCTEDLWTSSLVCYKESTRKRERMRNCGVHTAELDSI
ncbi:hypothetical protein TorRG33x02_150690 [Trema orientale]|uniref:Uncharacterized protein n=1 Tax=Trema orientale TaxID=63057 RepID=A0A2P5EUK9_TREOI|nr:hypothetical protein TorRG33x02_150690 [Trema orientale]